MKKYKFKALDTLYYAGDLIFIKNHIYYGKPYLGDNYLGFNNERHGKFYLNMYDPDSKIYLYSIMTDSFFKYGK